MTKIRPVGTDPEAGFWYVGCSDPEAVFWYVGPDPEAGFWYMAS